MNQQPDKLFRDKLQGYQQPVPSGAWNRVSQKASNRNQRVVWLRIAATVLIMVAGGMLLYPVFKEDVQQPVAFNETKTHPKESNKSQLQEPAAVKPQMKEATPLSADNSKITAPQGSEQRIPRTQQKQKGSTRPAIDEPASPVGKKEEPEVPESLREGNVAFNNEPSQEEAVREVNNATHDSKAQRKSVTIVLTAEEVNKKYLTKSSEAEATPEEKETSRFKRLLDKAYDLKNNQDLLGDLRQKKNEILAMNFKNDKQRTEND